MKTIKIKLAIRSFLVLLLAGSITGCGLRNRMLNKSRSSIVLEEAGSVVSNQKESYQGDRVIMVKDSHDHQYKVSISPLDTFTFSIEKGFRGKASSIEVMGKMKQKAEIIDSNIFSASIQRSSHKGLIRKVEGEQLASSKAVSKIWLNWWLTGILLALGLFILWGLYKFRGVM